jgi:hypothetical protein
MITILSALVSMLSFRVRSRACLVLELIAARRFAGVERSVLAQTGLSIDLNAASGKLMRTIMAGQLSSSAI